MKMTSKTKVGGQCCRFLRPAGQVFYSHRVINPDSTGKLISLTINS